MATKAQLEAELTKLRAELKEVRNSQTPSKDADADTEGPAPEPETDSADILHAMQDGDFGTALHQLTEELEGLTSRKPLLTALGVFVVGYLIGRTGHKG